MADDNVEIKETPEPEVIVSVEPDVVAPVAKVEEVKDPAVKELVDQYKALEAKSEEREKAKEEADRRAAAAQNEAAAARREAETARAAATSSNYDTVVSALASAQATMDAAKQAHKAARDAGDYDAEIEANDRIMQAKIDLRTYDEAKANIEARRSQPKITPVDAVEAYVQNRSEPTAKWLREHREYVIDPDKNLSLTAAHYDALSKRLVPDTEKYFEHVEKFIGLKKDDAPVTEGDNVQRPGAAAAPAVKKQAQRSVAPVGGSSANGGAPASNEVRLSSGEAKAATDGTHIWNYDDPSGQKKFKKGDPIGIQEFARRKQKLTQQGAYDRTYETQ
jgi:hypothetical protein